LFINPSLSPYAESEAIFQQEKLSFNLKKKEKLKRENKDEDPGSSSAFFCILY
jgi:hypothetical protein